MSDLSVEVGVDRFSDPLSDYEPARYNNDTQRVIAEDSVLAIQTQPCAEVRPGTSIRLALQVLRDLRIARLVVVENRRIVGIFTERDVLENIAERYQRVADSPVREFMTCDPVVVYECDPVGAALAAIAVGGYRHVPVLSMSDEVLGIVSPRRVFDFLQRRIGAEPAESQNPEPPQSQPFSPQSGGRREPV